MGDYRNPDHNDREAAAHEDDPFFQTWDQWLAENEVPC